MNKLMLDFDGTIFDSSRAFLKVYNSTVKNTGKESTLCWNFDDCGVQPQYIQRIFDSDLFAIHLNPYEGAIETIKELSKITEVNIVTIGTYSNIKNKIDVLDYFGLSKRVGMIPIIKPSDKGVVMDKSIITGNTILVDDHTSNLETCSAKYKVLFSYKGLDYDWQKGYEPQFKATEWNKEFYDMLVKMINDEM